MTVIGALSSFRELGEMSLHKRASILEPAAAGSTHDSSCERRFRGTNVISRSSPGGNGETHPLR